VGASGGGCSTCAWQPANLRFFTLRLPVHACFKWPVPHPRAQIAAHVWGIVWTVFAGAREYKNPGSREIIRSLWRCAFLPCSRHCNQDLKRPRHPAGKNARQWPLVALPERAAPPRAAGPATPAGAQPGAGRGQARAWRRPPASGAPQLGGHGSPMVPGAGPGGPVPLWARTAELRGPARRLQRHRIFCRLYPYKMSPVRAPVWSVTVALPNGKHASTRTRETAVWGLQSAQLCTHAEVWRA